MMKNKVKAKQKSIASPFFLSRQQDYPAFQLLIQTIREQLLHFKSLDVLNYIHDLQVNLILLKDRPLLALQTQRLAQHIILNDDDFNRSKQTFAQLWQSEMQLSQHSCLDLDPKYSAAQQFSSEIARFKVFFLDILYLYLCFQTPTLLTEPLQIEKYVQYLHQIQDGFTISKVTVRQQPDIESQSLIELPKHTALEFYAAKINEHWYKIIFNLDTQAISGYVVGAYIKSSETLK